MADIIKLMDEPVTVNAATAQPLFEAVDVSAYDELDLMLGIVGVAGTGSVTISIETSMQNAAETVGGTTNGWVEVASFTAQTAGQVYELKNFKNFVRYVRWRVKTWTGFNGVTFTISGLARRWSI